MTLTQTAQEILATRIPYIHCEELDNLAEPDITNNDDLTVYDMAKHVDSSAANVSIPSLSGHPLLTPDGERWLFRKMNYLKQECNQIKDRLNPKRPKRSLIEQFHKCREEANRTRDTLVEANTRLVASIAHKFATSRLEYEELISEGNMILVNSVDKFDFSRGFRFSTYATHAIQRHFYRLMQRKQRRKNREMSTPTNILSDVAPDRVNDQPLDHTVAEALISRFGDCLDEREAVIIRERFGLNDSNSAETLKVVADRVGLSKERVRQLQMRAIEKLQDVAIQMKLRLEPSF